MNAIDQSAARNLMLKDQIQARGVNDVRVLDAMGRVPRELFLPEDLRESAYDDAPLPIAGGQSISQPFIVGCMIDALNLQGGETVLEIGTGSGYAAAVLAQIVDDVFTIERIGELARDAEETSRSLHCDNVHVRHGDGTLGWPEQAPFDAIIVAAGGPRVPGSLKSQLKVGGRMVVPVGPLASTQQLVRVTRISEKRFETEVIADVRFVPLIGVEGWMTETDD